jgi:hypothetical protein
LELVIKSPAWEGKATVPEKPDDTIKFAEAEAKLYRGARRMGQISCDRMIIQHFTGVEEDVVIYERDGQRRAGLIRLLMTLQEGYDAGPVLAGYNEEVESVSPEDERRLLAVYDKFSCGEGA